jgi:hypothetical protein
MPKSKIEKEFQADEDGTVIVPKEIVPSPGISPTTVNKAVKREMSEKQRANMERMIEMNKEKWAKKREEKENSIVEEALKKKEEQQKLLDAGTHVRVKIKEKKQYKPREPSKPLPLRRTKAYEKTDNSESDGDDTDTVTETETDLTDSEIDERPKQRRVRREMKKTLRVVEKVNQVLNNAPPTNPYLSMLQGRWQ